MSAAVLAAALDLAAIGIEKWLITGRYDEWKAAGKSDAEIAEEYRRWRVRAIASAQSEIDRAP